ncbi:hypothetical protein AOQ84DRAFT_376813 [Glonium stellatum]|uniref:SNF2 N-terminal domain-containing protein n=1 Tax=Glonium stellatum TaxID=574774 RepID=A0A8E2F1F9_9PEZI|nr:hypothetical protein AOQ84DRAFT_376813 [Glonium stellatum]
MVEKESGKVKGNEFGSVWEFRNMENGRKRLSCVFAILDFLHHIILIFGAVHRYFNLITGLSVSERPKKSLGGLLADEMGLGKTLTVLALIAGSIDERSGGLADDDTLMTNINQQMTIRTTLIITPLSTHYIRERSSLNHRSVYALHGHFRWCLTGTPIQNRIEDFGALINFLRVQPFDSQPMFAHHIANPMKNGEQSGFKKLKTLVHCTSLRRTKASIFGALGFPPRINEEKSIELSQEEKSIYDALKDNCVERMGFMSCSEDSKKPVGNVFKLILRLRQICNHTSLLPAEVLNQVYNQDLADAISIGQDMCESCGSEATTPEFKVYFEDVFEGVGVLCTGCKPKDSDGSATDPLSDITLPNESNKEESMNVDINHSPSAKIEALLQNLYAYRAQPTAFPIKSLDLTAACRVHLMEPQWNPMAEEQALDRVHRMGQTREVIAIRYIAKGSIEEYITSIQKKKLKLIHGSFRGESPKRHEAARQYLQNWIDALK